MPVFVLGSCKPTSSLGVLPVPAPTPALRSTLARLKYQPQSPEPAVCPAHPQLEASPSGLFLLGVVRCRVLFCLHQRLPAYSCLRTAVCSCSNPSQWSVLRPSQHLPSHIQPCLPHLVWHQWRRPCLVWHCWLLLSLPKLVWHHLPQLVWYCRYRQRLPRLVWHCHHLPSLPCPVGKCQYSKPATPGLAPPARPGTPTPAPPAPATPGPALPAPAKAPKGFGLYSCHLPAKLLEKFHHLRQSLERCHWPRGWPPELLLLCLLDSLLLVFVLDSVISN